MTRATAPTPAPTPEPKPTNPEPLQQPIDPEKGRVKSPTRGESEHAKAL
ncbi:MAG TPA: hypothetical protein VKP68_11290 [Ramlibacter sp.]|nr:hypothetical protein [Ramlibacter sp.]